MIPAYNKKRCAAFPFETGIRFRRKTDFFPEEDTTKSYSGFEAEPTRLQAEGHSHHTGWATDVLLRKSVTIDVLIESRIGALIPKMLWVRGSRVVWYRIVACLVTSSSPVPLKKRRVGQRCTLNLSRAETSSRWCGVVFRRVVPAQVSSTSLDHGSKLRGPSPKALVKLNSAMLIFNQSTKDALRVIVENT
ncbi:uncharacterized protein TNCV_3320261 [Trichonephila clavipes]|nr:uncharacterized protein TNCV_3320261 [Trichonephila clavipes]